MNIPHPIIYYNTDFHWFLFMDIMTVSKTDVKFITVLTFTGI